MALHVALSIFSLLPTLTHGFVFADREIFPCVQLPLSRPQMGVQVPEGAAWANSTLTALILESRDSPLLVPTITAALANFPPRARIQIFHSSLNARTLYAAFLPFITTGKVVLVLLSCERFEVDSVTTSPHCWRAVEGEDIVLFQLDGTLCAGGRDRLEDFVGRYDFVGAPWAPSGFVSHIRSPVGNGGFSLRTRSTHLAIVERFDYAAWYARGLRDSHITGWSLHEDLFFVHYMPAVGGRVAPAHVAHAFSVETVFHPTPVGAHAFWKHAGSLSEAHVRTLLQHCPELVSAWAKDTADSFDFSLVGLEAVQAAARAGLPVDTADAGEPRDEIRWRRAPGFPPRRDDADLHTAARDGAGEGLARATAPVIAARTLRGAAGGAATPAGSMTIGWRVSAPVWVFGSAGGIGLSRGAEAALLLDVRGMSRAVGVGMSVVVPGTSAAGGAGALVTRGASAAEASLPLSARAALLAAIALTTDAEVSARDWLSLQRAWAHTQLRWSRLPALPTERRQRIDLATGAPLRPWTADVFSAARVQRPWWMRAHAQVVAPDLGASEDTALRQAAGVVAADGGSARAVLLIGPAARPAASFTSRLSTLLEQGGDLPLRSRNDWDLILLGEIPPLVLAAGAADALDLHTPARVRVYKPQQSHGVLGFFVDAPPPPPPPSKADADAATRSGAGALADVLWRPRAQPLTYCPPPISATGPFPAYLVRPSRKLLGVINEVRVHSTANLVTLAHPDANATGAPRRPPHATPWEYADAYEPPGVVPWLCAWRSVSVWAAVDALIAGDAGEADVTPQGGDASGDDKAPASTRPSLTGALALALNAVSADAAAAGRIPVLSCPRSLVAEHCTVDSVWQPPPL